MKSDNKFQINKSVNKVELLDVYLAFDNGMLRTDLYTKPTDAFLYLNTTSSPPKHVTKNIPKSQFVRIRRICSEKDDLFINCDWLSSFFVKRGYKQQTLQKTIHSNSTLIPTGGQAGGKNGYAGNICLWLLQ